MSKLIERICQEKFSDKQFPQMRAGDTVVVNVIITESQGRKRIQKFEGVVIKYARGQFPTVTVRRISAGGIGVNRTFFLLSPEIDSFEVIRMGRVRKSRIYYQNDRKGKAARIAEDHRPSRKRNALEAKNAAAVAEEAAKKEAEKAAALAASASADLEAGNEVSDA